MKKNNHVSFKEQYKNWASEERGMSEVLGAIFVLPILAFLIFALIESGVNMRYRILVENINQTAVQGISNDGALYWTRTSQPPITENNNWEEQETKKLVDLCGSTPGQVTSRCKQQPTAVCSVTPSTTLAPSIQVANTAGAEVKCVATFPYRPVSPLSNNVVTSMGFSEFFNKAITQTAYGRTVVGWQE